MKHLPLHARIIIAVCVIIGLAYPVHQAVSQSIDVPTAATMTRPADTTQYASGDLVANSTTAGSVVALQFKFQRSAQDVVNIKRWVLRKSDGTDVTGAAFRLWLFSSTPTFSTNGDNSAVSGNTTGAPQLICQMDIAAMSGLVDAAIGVGIPVVGSECIWPMNTSSPNSDGTVTLFGIYEARGTYTPASAETFTSTLYAIPDARNP